MALKTALKRYAGVYYTESKIKRWRERPDRCYWVAFKDAKTGKLIWERCGWASEGWTPEAAQRRRHELLEQDRAGDYKPKQERKSDQLTFGELMEKHYLPWAKENKGHSFGDFSVMLNWLKPRFADQSLEGYFAPGSGTLETRRCGMPARVKPRLRHALCIMRQAFNKAVVWRLWLGENPCKGVSFPCPNNARQRFLSQEEAVQVLESLRRHSDQLARIATMSLYGGLRLVKFWGSPGLMLT